MCSIDWVGGGRWTGGQQRLEAAAAAAEEDEEDEDEDEDEDEGEEAEERWGTCRPVEGWWFCIKI